MLGTGRIDDDREIEQKLNGVGSNNHDLRSLFILGNQIYVRSGGLQTLLDFHGGTYPAPMPDPSSTRQRGAHLFVPFRSVDEPPLAAYGIDRQRRDLDQMSDKLAPTLLKL